MEPETLYPLIEWRLKWVSRIMTVLLTIILIFLFILPIPFIQKIIALIIYIIFVPFMFLAGKLWKKYYFEGIFKPAIRKGREMKESGKAPKARWIIVANISFLGVFIQLIIITVFSRYLTSCFHNYSLSMCSNSLSLFRPFNILIFIGAIFFLVMSILSLKKVHFVKVVRIMQWLALIFNIGFLLYSLFFVLSSVSIPFG